VAALAEQQSAAPVWDSRDAGQGEDTAHQGLGDQVSTWTHDGITGQDLANSIHDAQGKDQPLEHSAASTGGWGGQSVGSEEDNKDTEDSKSLLQGSILATLTLPTLTLPAVPTSLSSTATRVETASVGSLAPQATDTLSQSVASSPVHTVSGPTTTVTNLLAAQTAPLALAPIEVAALEAPSAAVGTQTTEASVPAGQALVARASAPAAVSTVRSELAAAGPVSLAVAPTGDANALAVLQVTAADRATAPAAEPGGAGRTPVAAAPVQVVATTGLVGATTLWLGSAALAGAEARPAQRVEAGVVDVPLARGVRQQPDVGVTTTEAGPQPGASDENLPVGDVVLRVPDAVGGGLAEVPAPDVSNLGQDLRDFLRRVTGLFGGLTRVRGAAAFLPVLGAIRLASSPDEDSTQTELPSTSDLSGEELS
jgi:hypothetical protein